jgi:hypothetical protein
MNKKQITTILFSIVLFIVLSGCPTPWIGLEWEDNYWTKLAKEFGPLVGDPLEYEDGVFAKMPQSDPTYDLGQIHESGNASGKRFIKEINWEHGRVDLTIPRGFPQGYYMVFIGWSGAPTGDVTLILNPGAGEEIAIVPRITERTENDWDMMDPTALLIWDNIALKAGDVIRTYGGVLGVSSVDEFNWIHLDAIFIIDPK